MDDEYARLELGDPSHQIGGKWVSLCMAYAALGRQMTGLPIDFQIQQMTRANRLYPSRGHPRFALGMVDLRFRRASSGDDTA